MVSLNPFKRRNQSAELLSPWTPSGLQSIVIADIFGDLERFPATRADAMQCGPVVKARALIAGGISRLPLYASRNGARLAEQPTFLYRSDSAIPPSQRLLWTVDDLMFSGYSLWAVTRGAAGQVLDAYRVPVEEWTFGAHGTVLVNGSPVRNDEVILFCGPQEGLLDIGGIEIRSYIDLLKTRASRLRNPVAQQVLHPTEEMNLEAKEITELLDEYAAVHKAGSNPVSWLPHNINLEEHGQTESDDFDGQANQLGLAFAQKLNVEPTLIGAAIEAQGSLNYQNQEGSRSWFVDANLMYWLEPILARLSEDDVVPRGVQVQADLTGLVALPQPENTPALED